jgi:prepilin-type N-terminal cleavage/methylation domain-containing protein/prepilin-type processing-associated H-X9-DG protein
MVLRARLPGFTLLEVLVVVAIIALLAAILIPALSEARDHARSAKCLANMRDMGTGVNTFAAAHKSRFQLASFNVTSKNDLQKIGDLSRTLFAYESGTGANPNLLGWPVVLSREAGARGLHRNLDWGIKGSINANKSNPAIRKPYDALVCPADKIQVNTYGNPSASGLDVTTDYIFGYLSYGINLDVSGVRAGGRGLWKDGKTSYDAGAGDQLVGRLDAVIRPSEVMLFVDAGLGEQNYTLAGAPGAPTVLTTAGPANNRFQVPGGPLLEFVDRAYQLKIQHKRHRRATVNITYADGHGGFVKRVTGNPLYNAAQDWWIPDWRYLPKVRVSPYEVGQYPTIPP